MSDQADDRKRAKRKSTKRWESYNAFGDVGASDAELSVYACLTWHALFRHANPLGIVQVSAARIMAMYPCISRRSLTRAVAELRDARLLKVLEEGRPNGTPAVYRIRPFKPAKKPVANE